MDIAEKNEPGYRVTVHLLSGGKSFGPGVAELLERVEREGSLRRAAASMNMAYSKAWKILKNAEDMLGFALLNAIAGGRGGGGAELTPEAKKLVTNYRSFEHELDAFAEGAFARIFGGDAP